MVDENGVIVDDQVEVEEQERQGEVVKKVDAGQSDVDARQKQFDKDRQREQQELANARRHIAKLEAEIQRSKQKDETSATFEDENPLEVLAALRKKEAELETSVKAIQQMQEVQRFKTTFADTLDRLDKKHGPEFRNDALAHARQLALDRGYSLVGDDAPELRELCDLVELGYLSVKKEQPAGTKRPLPKADTGRAGTAVSAKAGIARGTPEEVLADMRNRGRFRNLTTED